MRTRLVMPAVAALVVLGFADPSYALTYTQTVQFGPGATDYQLASGSVNGTPTTIFLFFDTAGGAVLNSVALSSSYRFSSSITLTNTAQASSSGSVATQSAAQFGASYNGSTIVPTNIVNTSNDPVDGNSYTSGGHTLSPIAFDLRGNASSYTLAGNTSQTFTSNGFASGTVMVDTDPVQLAAFGKAGGDTFTPLFSTLTGLNLSGSNVSATQTTIATGTMTITYNYTPAIAITEPASMLLLGVGLAGLGLVRRIHRA